MSFSHVIIIELRRPVGYIIFYVSLFLGNLVHIFVFAYWQPLPNITKKINHSNVITQHVIIKSYHRKIKLKNIQLY